MKKAPERDGAQDGTSVFCCVRRFGVCADREATSVRCRLALPEPPLADSGLGGRGLINQMIIATSTRAMTNAMLV